MEVETFLKKLQKARYFEGYSEAATAKAIKAIRKNYAEGLADSRKPYFEKFPGLSLVVLDVDQEMTGRDDLKGILRDFGRASFGLFSPQAIKIRRKAGEERYWLEFTLQGKSQTMELEDDSWIPNAFFEQLDKFTARHCAGLLFQAVEYPDSGQSGFYLWCTPRAWKAVARAGLIPSGKQRLEPSATSDDSTPPESPRKKSSPPKPVAKSSEFPPPADVARAERMGVYRLGRWRIPKLSQKAIDAWQEIANTNPTSVQANGLNSLIGQTFDLLSACHCGLTGIGNAKDYARQVVSLAEHYLFGAWRVGYVEDGVALTAKTASKALYWPPSVEMGCTAAICLDDKRNLRRFLEYIGDDVYDEYREADLAYYRLLSDVVLQRESWNWTEQAQLILQSSEEQFANLLPCLEALRQADEPRFQKAIRKFGSKPKYRPPSWFRMVVDGNVTILAQLARQQGWGRETFSLYLQDRILDPQGWA